MARVTLGTADFEDEGLQEILADRRIIATWLKANYGDEDYSYEGKRDDLEFMIMQCWTTGDKDEDQLMLDSITE